MARYTMEDGTVVDTRDAKKYWDGADLLPRATGSPWVHETLYKTGDERYYVERRVEHEAEWVSVDVAALWLQLNGHELPEDLPQYPRVKLHLPEGQLTSRRC